MKKIMQTCLMTAFLGSGLLLNGCAFWLQQQDAEPAFSKPVAEATNADSSDNPYQYLEHYINQDKAREMLSSEPLQSKLATLIKADQQALFAASRELEKPVSQVMQGYILSEGSSTAGKEVSLVIIDSERQALMVVLVNKGTLKYKVLESYPTELPEEVMDEMREYADNWALGQLGLAP